MPDIMTTLANNIVGVDASILALVLIVVGALWKMPKERLDKFTHLIPWLFAFGGGLITLRITVTIAEVVR